MAADEPLRYRRLRAPTEDQTALIEPPLAEIPAMVARNLQLSGRWDQQSGVSFAAWRDGARDDLQSAASPRRATGSPIIASGHQPSLYHPGVWLKFFLLSQVAHSVGGHGVNLTIDNDALRSPTIRVPTGSPQTPRAEEVPLDDAAEETPWEDRPILNRSLFSSFASRVLSSYAPLRAASDFPSAPLVIESLWEEARRLAGSTAMNLGDVLAHARAAVEKRYGLQTEIDEMSGACRSVSWYEFVAVLFRRCAEFHSIYNSVLAEYRTINHLHSRVHPVPDLARDGDWLEMPFWIWTLERPQRQSLYVRNHGQSWEVRSRGGEVLSEKDVWERALQSLEIRLRPKALITTMYARLVLSDLFIHGIGGAKYDEVTDAIIRRFFGIEPPGYVTATATVRLPLERPQVNQDDLTVLDQEYRDTMHHPEEFADEYSGHHGAEFVTLVKQKQELIAHRWQDKQKKVWHDQITEANERMSLLLEPYREQIQQKRERLLAELHRLRILSSREYSFCLFPEAMLVPLLKKLAGMSDY